MKATTITSSTLLMKSVVLSIALLLILQLPAMPVRAEAASLSVDEAEYDLYVYDYPYDISEPIYAKFKTAKDNVDSYYYSIIDTEEPSKMLAALEAKNINTSDENAPVAVMDFCLYMETDDDTVTASADVELLLPLPDDAQENPDAAKLYKLSGSSAEQVVATMYNVDDVYYLSFEATENATYAYTYELPSEEEEEEYEEEEPEPDITEEPTPELTRSPEPTESSDSVTSAPSNKSSGNSSNGSSSSKDSVPKTGDDFPLAGIIIVGCAALIIFGIVVYKLRTSRH